jgi:6-phosphogluconate dehydrogenase
MAEQHSEYGIYGSGELGRAVALRLAESCQRVSLGGDSPPALRDFVSTNRATRGGLVAFADARDFVASLLRPRVVVAASKAHRAQLAPWLDEDDRCIVPALAAAALVAPAAEALSAELLRMRPGSEIRATH